MFAEVCFSILKQLNSCFKQISKSKSQKVSTFDALFKHAPKNFIARLGDLYWKVFAMLPKCENNYKENPNTRKRWQ